MKKLCGIALALVLFSISLTGCDSANSITTITSPVVTTNTVTTTDALAEKQAAAHRTAESFIKNSSTFKFDGIAGSLAFSKDDPGFTSAFMSWSFTFKFETGHPGHGDRTGQILAQVITTHYATVTVNLEKNTVIWAVCDNTWDMVRERDLAVRVSGIVVSGGDTTPPGGPIDAPRVFIYRILRDEGFFTDVKYTAYPSSPAGDAKAKFTLDFYNGTVAVGDRMDAYGILDRNTNVLVVAEACDFIQTSLHKATVVGVVVEITDMTGISSQTYPPKRYMFNLLREDGTRVYVTYTEGKGTAVSLIGETVQVGEFLKATGIYDGRTNTVMTGPDDFMKTYQFRP